MHQFQLHLFSLSAVQCGVWTLANLIVIMISITLWQHDLETVSKSMWTHRHNHMVMLKTISMVVHICLPKFSKKLQLAF